MKFYHTPKSPESVGKLFLEISKQATKAENLWRNCKLKQLFVCIDKIDDAMDEIQTESSYLHNETESLHTKQKTVEADG